MQYNTMKQPKHFIHYTFDRERGDNQEFNIAHIQDQIQTEFVKNSSNFPPQKKIDKMLVGTGIR